MAQLAVSVVGAAIGFYVGGSAGAQVGWAAGSLIGAVAFPDKQQGPRLNDTKVQISSYGAGIPIAFGGVRLAGNVIWSTDLIESESEGGKGGPSVSTFNYSVSCAIAICEGEIGGIRRVWADAKLVYDAREDATPETLAASASFAEHMTVYLGSETQDPDPTIEAAEGAGNVEAYRGVAYVVFDNLPLADYGNRIPNFSFETTTETPVVVGDTLLEPLRVYDWVLNGDGRPVHGVGDTYYASPYLGDAGTDFTTIAESNAYSYTYEEYGYGPYSVDWINVYRTSQTDTFFNLDGDVLGPDPEYVWYALGVAGDGLWDRDRRTTPVITFASSLELLKSVRYLLLHSGIEPIVTKRMEGLLYTATTEDPGHPFYSNLTSGVTNPDSGSFFTYVLSVAWTYPLLDLSAKRVPTHPAKSCFPGNPCTASEGSAELPGSPTFCISCEGAITKNYDWTIISGTAKVLCDVEYRDGVLYQNALGPVLLPGDPNYSNAAYWTAARDAAVEAGTMLADVSYPVVVSSYAEGIAPDTTTVEPGSVLLSDIVTDVCERAGLDASDIDVTALDDVVQGYVIPRQMPARNALEPLRMAYFFDAVENGEQIVFVKRGGASVVTITADDLGASENGEAIPLVVPKRAQETELPAECNGAYMVREADYQTGTQQARRVTTGSQQIVSAELPIVLTDDEAAGIVDVWMVDAWQGRVLREFTTTRKFTKYLPTDVVTVNDGEFTYRGRLLDKNEDGPLIHWKFRDEAQATFIPSATSSPTSGGGGSISFSGPITVELMDIPALRDVDDEAGFYAAATGFTSVFNGGVLFKSLDDSTFSSLQAMNVRATLGQTSTVLTDFEGGNIVDEANFVTVVLHAGSGGLSSISNSALLAGGNAALLGDEVLQFRTATLTATNTYRLSGLLRGRRGTEQHMATHTNSDRFVLLNEATIYRVLQSLPQIGAAYYRAVAYGLSITDAVSEEFTNTGAALKPLSPVHLVATPDGSDYVVTWIRRTRIGGNWADNVDAPLSEASESYRVRVLGPSDAILEEQTVSTQTATVASYPSALTVEVCQMSATVGAGFPATISL